MAVKFLDYTGLGYLWSKIKAWCNATFAAITHNHASNAVNTMTGYSKPSNGSAIIASDSLNSAIGKLEAKIDSVDDSNYVHKTGDESIEGYKDIKYLLVLRNGDTDGNAYPSSGTSYTELFFVGKDYVTGSSLINNPARIGEIQHYKTDSGSTGLEMTIRWFDSDGGNRNLGLVRTSSGVSYGYCPSTPLPENNNEPTAIVTRDFISLDTRIVHTTGDEHIAGEKFFDALRIDNGSIDFNNLSNTSNDNEYIYWVDSTITPYAAVQTSTRIGMNRICFRLRELGNTAPKMSSVSAMGITSDSNYPNGYGFCPTISNTAESSDVIATTAWVRSATGNTALNAATATKLATARQLKVALGSTGTATFDGSGNQNSIPVSGTLAVGNGGTGLTSLDSFVRTSGAQAIGGYKYFTSYSTGFQNPDVDYTKTQSGNTNSYLYFNDKNGVTMSCLQNHVTTSDNRLRFMIRKQKDRTTATSDLPCVQLIYSNDGTLAFEGSGNGVWYLGSSGTGRWKEVWSANNTIQTSDERLKTEITAVPEDILNAWENVDFYKFKMLEAVSTKGLNNARFHSGVIAQQIKSTFENAGLDVTKYSFFCYNHWDAKEAEYDQYGNLDTPAKPEGDEYSIRYGELLCIEAAYQRRKNKILENRISELEKQVSDMLQILQSLKGAN